VEWTGRGEGLGRLKVVGIERGRWRVWKEERKGYGFWSKEFERVKVEEMKG
jgi:hypothetical protein